MDEYNLQRFVDAQNDDGIHIPYATALREIKAGKRESHWIWYVFPQLHSLGKSHTAHYFGIHSLDEARAYLQHPQLGANLLEISKALLELECSDAFEIMDCYTNKMKLRSSMTLFAEAQPDCEVFQKVLDKFFGGKKDSYTLSLLGLK